MSADDLPIIKALESRPSELTLGELWAAAGIIRALYEGLEGLVGYAEAVRRTAGMGKNQLARFEAANAALAKTRGVQ